MTKQWHIEANRRISEAGHHLIGALESISGIELTAKEKETRKRVQEAVDTLMQLAFRDETLLEELTRALQKLVNVMEVGRAYGHAEFTKAHIAAKEALNRAEKERA